MPLKMTMSPPRENRYSPKKLGMASGSTQVRNDLLPAENKMQALIAKDRAIIA